MNKQEARDKIAELGDAVVTYRAENSKKLKYNVVTLEFNTPCIKAKRTHAVEDENTILTFAWDTDSYRLLRTDLITSIVPLAALLRNV
tara:strand:- start:78365 stop:78628 length:264 start_codon:yes stop_codon:yes gene_type:complete